MAEIFSLKRTEEKFHGFQQTDIVEFFMDERNMLTTKT